MCIVEGGSEGVTDSEVMEYWTVPWDNGGTVGFLAFDLTVFTSLFERWSAGIMERGIASVGSIVFIQWRGLTLQILRYRNTRAFRCWVVGVQVWGERAVLCGVPPGRCVSVIIMVVIHVLEIKNLPG